jgi:predicted metal-dependent hydrolase
MIQGRLFEAEPLSDEHRLSEIFENAFRALLKKNPPVTHAEFYPYAGLSSTIRLRSGKLYVRISDVLRSAPPKVIHALVCILLAKLYRLKVSRELERTYREHALHPAVVTASDSARRERGYKITTSARGKVYNLEAVFDRLNSQYFEGALPRPVISWGRKRTRRVLGHHDHVHAAIIMSPSLDSLRVPSFVVEYVLYHEMLHVKHPPRAGSGRTVYHSRAFRADERRFADFDRAVKWLDRNGNRLKGPGRPRRARGRSSEREQK